MDPVLTMPNLESMVKENYTPKQWLNYYKNLWRRNLVARSIDVETDKLLKAADPMQLVQSDDGRMIAVKERLENRKIIVQDAIDLLAAIEKLDAIPEADLAKTIWSPEALAIAEDMMPASNDQREYDVLKDFADSKAGEKIKVGAWSQKQIDEKVAEGVIKLPEEVKAEAVAEPEKQAEEKAAEPAPTA